MTEEEMNMLQQTINFVEMFSSAASKHNITEITNVLSSIYKTIIKKAKEVIKYHSQEIMNSML